MSNSPPAAADPAPRLIDLDANKYYALKQCFVFGSYTENMIHLGEFLKNADLEVYDFASAAGNFERDFPLWLEAARLKDEGAPYSAEDFNKLTGKYTVIFCGQPTSFTKDVFKAFPYAKVIVLEDKCTSKPSVPRRLFSKFKWTCLTYFDPDFFKPAKKLTDLTITPAVTINIEDLDVRPSQLLRVSDLKDSKEVTTFLGIHTKKTLTSSFDRDPLRTMALARVRNAFAPTIETALYSTQCIIPCLSLGGAAYITARAILERDATTSAIVGASALITTAAAVTLKHYADSNPNFGSKLNPIPVLKSAWNFISRIRIGLAPEKPVVSDKQTQTPKYFTTTEQPATTEKPDCATRQTQTPREGIPTARAPKSSQPPQLRNRGNNWANRNQLRSPYANRAVQSNQSPAQSPNQGQRASPRGSSSSAGSGTAVTSGSSSGTAVSSASSSGSATGTADTGTGTGNGTGTGTGTGTVAGTGTGTGTKTATTPNSKPSSAPYSRQPRPTTAPGAWGNFEETIKTNDAAARAEAERNAGKFSWRDVTLIETYTPRKPRAE